MIQEAPGYKKVTSGPLLAIKGEKSWDMGQLLMYEEDEGGHKKNGKGQ